MNLNNFGKKLKINKRLEKNITISEYDLFVEIINNIEKQWANSNKMYEMFKVNLSEFEEGYYSIIEDLIMIKFGLWKSEIILWYIFGRLDNEGNVYPLVVSTKDVEETFNLSTPKELWEFLEKLTKSKEKE